MVEKLRAEGVSVELDPEPDPNGRFPWLEDPEGNRLQVWEANAAALARDPDPTTNPPAARRRSQRRRRRRAL